MHTEASVGCKMHPAFLYQVSYHVKLWFIPDEGLILISVNVFLGQYYTHVSAAL